MRRKEIERLKPLKTKEEGHVATLQELGQVLILNIFSTENY